MPSRRWEWLLPPALAVVAIGLQLLIDVPHHPMVLDHDEVEIEPETKTTTAARTSRSRTRDKWKRRGTAYTDKLRKRWATRPLADEPVDPRFAAHHEPVLDAVARKAEAAVVGANEELEVAARARCHTIRCELVLCADDEALLDALAEQLPRFHVGRRPLWHALRELDGREPGDSNHAEQGCRRFLVDFAVEGADPRYLVLRDPGEADDSLADAPADPARAGAEDPEASTDTGA